MNAALSSSQTREEGYAMCHKRFVYFLLFLLLLGAPAFAVDEVFLPPIEALPETGDSVPVAPALDVSTAFDTGTLPAPSPSALIVGTEFARINWTDDYVEASGQAVAPTGKEKTSQGKLLARRGAIVDLQRNLLEAIQGVRVDAKTSMTDFMANDTVRTEVQGLVKGVEISDASWDGDIYTVTGRVKLDKVRTAVLPGLPKAPGQKPVPPTPPAGKISASGLLIDATHLPLIPAMFFRVVDENGKEVYGIDFADADRFLASGLCDYHTNLAYAKGAPRIASTPLVAKAVRTVAPQNVDIVISNADAAKVRGSSYDFRIPCRVTVVKR